VPINDEDDKEQKLAENDRVVGTYDRSAVASPRRGYTRSSATA